MSNDNVEKPQPDSTNTPIEELSPLAPSPEEETAVKGGFIGSIRRALRGTVKPPARGTIRPI